MSIIDLFNCAEGRHHWGRPCHRIGPTGDGHWVECCAVCETTREYGWLNRDPQP